MSKKDDLMDKLEWIIESREIRSAEDIFQRDSLHEELDEILEELIAVSGLPYYEEE